MLANVKSMLRAIVVGAAVLTVTSVSAVAWERVPYSAEAVAEAQASSVPFIIHVHAVWCSTCQAQDNVLAQLDSDPRFADLLIIRVDYDSQKHVMRLFRVPERSTFVAYQGATEISRQYAETSFEGIRDYLLAAMQ